MIYKKLKNYSRGFTLVETLVAISILVLVITATLTAVQKGIQSSIYAKDQIVAFYLAQEAMEFVKNVRDEDSLHAIAGALHPTTGQPYMWLTGLSERDSDPCYFGYTCVIDSNVGINAPAGTIRCPGGFGSCPNIAQEAATGLLGYNSAWPLTNFKREIQFQSISANEVSVIIRISWISESSNKSFQITESLFNRL